MLHYKTILPSTLELLRKLMDADNLLQLRLVGGTAYALQIGHRTSVDIDLFGTINFVDFELNTVLSEIGDLQIIRQGKNINVFLVNGIKTDIVNYPYKWLDSFIEIDGIRMATTKDIAAMKLAAITNRGTKKDFTDIYYLLQEYTLEEMMSFYLQKYHDGSEFLVIKSLGYFADAENNDMPFMFEEIEWVTIKNVVEKTVKDYLN